MTHIFGDNVVKIEHIGSTSVTGMLAKPQIDVIVVVKDLKVVERFYQAMAIRGFQSFGNYIQKQEPEEYFTKNNTSGERTYSIHVMQDGNPEIEDTLNFRDYLRANAHARDAYIIQKQKLLSEFGAQDYNAYGRGKVDFLEDLKSKARDWKRKQGQA